MPLIKFDSVSLAFGHHALLDHADLQIDPGERVCLVGRNGTGKSTLMKLITGDILPDEGSVWRQAGVKIARLRQDVPNDDTRKVFDVVADGLGNLSTLIRDYHAVTKQLETDYDEKVLERLSRLQHDLEAADGWRLQQQVDAVITRLDLPAEKCINELSGGWRRRALLAQALVSEPDLLLLDEPTNHLDIEAIRWLEEFLLTQTISILFISHDRTFIRRLSGRVIELDRGRLTSWPGSFDDYLVRKEEALAVEEDQNALFDKRLADEERWIRQGVKARRTRNEGRVRRLEAMRAEHAERRNRVGTVNMNVDSGNRSGKRVFEAEHVSYRYDGEMLFNDVNTVVMRGDRVGLIGPNGCGKSTLLRLLLGGMPPTEGQVELGTNIQVAYFDQQREQLDPEKSVIDNISEGRERIEVQGVSKHVIGYLKDFLFDPERLRSPVKTLSGGERNRLLLAKLFTKPANVLVLDEPTNDLDMETLELLENLLVEYTGTLLLVSHDRAFLDNVVTSTLVFEGEGRVNEYVGGYEDYVRQSQSRPSTANKPAKTKSNKPESSAPAAPAATSKRKLNNKEQRELAALPLLIEKLEAEQTELTMQTNDPEFYKQDKPKISEVLDRLTEISQQLEVAFERWGELE